jgi:hypothetical protein
MIVGTSWLDCSQVAWSNIKLVNYLWPIIDQNHLVKRCKTRSHVKHGLLWLDCDSQIRTKLPNLWGIFDRILKIKNGLFDAQSFKFKKESFWFQKLHPWCCSSFGRSKGGLLGRTMPVGTTGSSGVRPAMQWDWWAPTTFCIRLVGKKKRKEQRALLA